jgi:hypothetical protein
VVHTAKATGRGGQAVDELTTNLVQDSLNPLGDVQDGPAARTDARHKFTISAVIQAPYSITVSPIFRYRSALPIHTWYGYDNNLTASATTSSRRHSSTPASTTPAWPRRRKSVRAKR